MSPDLALALAQRGVRTREELAEQSVDDLAEIEGLDEAAAGALIMKARENWFQAEKRRLEGRGEGADRVSRFR